jgi:hypothetical protein
VAQHSAGGSAPRPAGPPAEAAQFDFLVGEWSLNVIPRVSGLAAKIHGIPKLVGTWKAWRTFDGWGIEDEMRITDASGNPMSLASAMRFYDATAKQWTQALFDVYRGRFATSTGSWSGNQMTFLARGTDSEGKPVVTRTRFFDITPTAFRFQQDRSQDDGKTWQEGTLKIEAKRTAATTSR